jgi:hypothetical protein
MIHVYYVNDVLKHVIMIKMEIKLAIFQPIIFHNYESVFLPLLQTKRSFFVFLLENKSRKYFFSSSCRLRRRRCAERIITKSIYMHLCVRINFIITAKKTLPPESCVFFWRTNTHTTSKKMIYISFLFLKGFFIYHRLCGRMT